MNKKIIFVILAVLLFNININSLNNKEDEYADTAYDAYEKQNDNEAFKYANLTLEINPKNIKALFIRSKLYFFREEYKLSIVDINTALDVISKSDNVKLKLLKSPFMRDRGVIYDIFGQYENALNDFLEVLPVFKANKAPDFEIAMVYFDISLANFNLKRNEESLNNLKQAIDYNPFELRYYDLGIYLLQTLNKNNNLNYYKERAILLQKYSNIFESKIKDKIFNVSTEEYNNTKGEIEKYYELKFTKSGDVQDPKLFPVIKVNDVLEEKYFSDSFTEFNGSYMLGRKNFTSKKLKINAIKIETFYEDSDFNDLHFIYKIKVEENK